MKERNGIQRKMKLKHPGEANQLESQNPKDSDPGATGTSKGQSSGQA